MQEIPDPNAPQRPADGTRLTRVLAVIGAFAGILGVVVGGLNYIDARRIDLRLAAVAYTPGDPVLHPPIAVGIINKGQRATSVTEGQILLDGSRRGRVDRLLLDSRVLDRPHSMDELRRVSSPLPADLPAGRSFAAAVIWGFSGPDYYGRIWEKTFRQESGTALRDHKIKIRLKLDPGGWRSVTVPLVPAAGSESPVFRVRDGWYVSLGLRKGRVSAVLVTSDFGDPVIVDLKIWRALATKPTLALSQPISQTYSTIPIGKLPPGRYSFALTVAGEAVATASFVNPCRRALRHEKVINVDACYGP